MNDKIKALQEHLELDDSEAAYIAEYSLEIRYAYKDKSYLVMTAEEACEWFDRDRCEDEDRGHVLATYDGEEHEVGKYFIYRTN